MCVPSQIYSKYLRTWFAIDFMSTVPVDSLIPLMMPNLDRSNLRTLKLIRALRLIRLIKLARLLKLKRTMRVVEDYIGGRLLMIFFIFFFKFSQRERNSELRTDCIQFSHRILFKNVNGTLSTNLLQRKKRHFLKITEANTKRKKKIPYHHHHHHVRN